MNKRRFECALWFGLYAFALANLTIFHLVRMAADTAPIGEELRCGLGYAIYFEQRLQESGYATNFSGDMFFWLASYLLPLTIDTPRIATMLTSAAIAPTLSLVVKQLLPNATLIQRIFPGILFCLIPAMMWHGVMGFQWLLDALCSIFVLLLVLRIRWEDMSWSQFRYLAFTAVLFAYSVHIYPASLGTLAISLAIAVFNAGHIAFKKGWKEGRRAIASAAIFCGAALTLSLWPYVYYRNDNLTFLRSGGQANLSWDTIKYNAWITYRDFFIEPSSYLSGGWLKGAAFPWTSTGAAILLLVLAGMWSLRKNRTLYWLLLIAIGGMLLSVLTGPNPGIRRATAAVWVLCVLAGVGVGALMNWYQSHEHRNWSIVFGIALLGSILCPWFWYGSIFQCVLAAFLIFAPILLFVRDSKWRTSFVWIVVLSIVVGQSMSMGQSLQYIQDNYKSWLQREFKYIPGSDYEETMEILLSRRIGKELHLSTDDYQFDTALMLALMCDRRDLNCGPLLLSGKGWIDTRLKGLNIYVEEAPMQTNASLPAS